MVGPTSHRPEDPDATHTVAAAPTPWTAWSGLIMRAIARAWVIGLLVMAAVGSGFALNQMFQAQARLDELRGAPGPDAYAIVAYRRELERQLKSYAKDRTSDSVPMAPPRPRLLEEIDLARQRNQGIGLAPPAGGRLARDAIVRAPE